MAGRWQDTLQTKELKAESTAYKWKKFFIWATDERLPVAGVALFWFWDEVAELSVEAFMTRVAEWIK